MSSSNDQICVRCKETKSFRFVTEDYRPLITENEKNYLGQKIVFCKTIKIDLPKPTWTDLYGNPVLQSGLVLIGGNGLNS